MRPKGGRGNSKGGFSGVYCAYRKGAKKRGLAFILLREDFAKLTKENCWYCGRPPSQIKRSSSRHMSYYLYNGIDRVDNNVGYILANCVPCCGVCNKMKSNRSGEDFINQVRKIARNLNIQ